jgi:hypothetical protein
VTLLLATARAGQTWLATGGEDGTVTIAAESRLDNPDNVLNVDAHVTDLRVLHNGSQARNTSRAPS